MRFAQLQRMLRGTLGRTHARSERDAPHRTRSAWEPIYATIRRVVCNALLANDVGEAWVV